MLSGFLVMLIFGSESRLLGESLEFVNDGEPKSAAPAEQDADVLTDAPADDQVLMAANPAFSFPTDVAEEAAAPEEPEEPRPASESSVVPPLSMSMRKESVSADAPISPRRSDAIPPTSTRKTTVGPRSPPVSPRKMAEDIIRKASNVAQSVRKSSVCPLPPRFSTRASPVTISLSDM